MVNFKLYLFIYFYFKFQNARNASFVLNITANMHKKFGEKES